MQYLTRTVRRHGPSARLYVHSDVSYAPSQEIALKREYNRPNVAYVIDVARIDHEADIEATLAPNTEN